MSTKKIKTRVQQKHDFEANWITAGQNGFVPLAGEIIVYAAEADADGNILAGVKLPSGENSRTIPYTYPRFKFGDGSTNINDLPFAAIASRAELDEDILAVIEKADDAITDSKQINYDYLPFIKTTHTYNYLFEGSNLTATGFGDAEMGGWPEIIYDCDIKWSDYAYGGKDTSGLTLEVNGVEYLCTGFSEDYWGDGEHCVYFGDLYCQVYDGGIGFAYNSDILNITTPVDVKLYDVNDGGLTVSHKIDNDCLDFMNPVHQYKCVFEEAEASVGYKNRYSCSGFAFYNTYEDDAGEAYELNQSLLLDINGEFFKPSEFIYGWYGADEHQIIFSNESGAKVYINNTSTFFIDKIEGIAVSEPFLLKIYNTNVIESTDYKIDNDYLQILTKQSNVIFENVNTEFVRDESGYMVPEVFYPIDLADYFNGTKDCANLRLKVNEFLYTCTGPELSLEESYPYLLRFVTTTTRYDNDEYLQEITSELYMICENENTIASFGFSFDNVLFETTGELSDGTLNIQLYDSSAENVYKIDPAYIDFPQMSTGEGNNSLQFAGATEATGEGSIAMGDQSSSVTDYSVAIGKEVTAGCKAYYFSAIDLENKNIYLSETKEELPIISGVIVNKVFHDGDEVELTTSDVFIYNGIIFDQEVYIDDAGGGDYFYDAYSKNGDSLYMYNCGVYDHEIEEMVVPRTISNISISFADGTSVDLDSIESYNRKEKITVDFSDHYDESFETPAYKKLEIIYIDPESTLTEEQNRALVEGKIKLKLSGYRGGSEDTWDEWYVESTIFDKNDHYYYVSFNSYLEFEISTDFKNSSMYSSSPEFDEYSGTLAYTVSDETDEFCIINGQYHSAFCGKVTAIDHNKITYEGDLGFTEISTSDTRPFEHDHVFYTPTNPSIGVIDDLFVGSFAAGRYNVAAGEDAVVAGYGNMVGANHGAAFGKNNRVGNFGFVTGNSNDATGSCAYVEGKENVNQGYMGHVEGRNNKIAKADTDNNRYVHVEGYSNTHNAGKNNHVEGVLQKVEGGECLHIEGRQNTSKAGTANHIEGTLNNIIKGNYNHVEGRSNDITSGNDNHVEGYQNTSNGSAQHVAGKFNKANSKMSRITGGGTSENDRRNIEELDWEGNLTLAGSVNALNGYFNSIGSSGSISSYDMETDNLTVSSYASFNGHVNITGDIEATGSSIFGTGHTVDSDNTQVEGKGNTVTSAVGVNHVEGMNNIVDARYAHVEGVANEIVGDVNRVHIEGWHNIASSNDQHVAGKYNKDVPNTARITGSGSKNARKNIEELDWEGNAWFASSVKVGADKKALATEEFANNAATKVKDDLLNGAGAAYDTLKELGTLIDENVDAIEALEKVATNKADKDHTHNYAGSSSVGGAATSAEKLTTLNKGNWYTPVYFSSGVPYECTKLDESMLQWGSRVNSGTISPLDMACSNIHSANRFAFAKPAGIAIEYSTDNGASWVDCEVTDERRTALVSGIDTYLGIGNKTTNDSATVNDKLRITLDATTMGVYTGLRKLLILISTNGATGCNVNIEKSLKADPSAYEQVGTYDITGWSGWNSIPFPNMSFGGGASQTTNVGRLRLTFGITGLHDTYSSVLQVLNIYAIGDNYWATPSELARTGHVYQYDASQNVTFPAAITATQITATQFNGTFNGTANNANSLNFQTISAPPTGGGCYPVFVSSDFTIENVTFPKWSTGMFISRGETLDATLYVIDSSGNMYSAFRNNSEWRQASAVINSKNISSQELITVADIDAICGTTIQDASSSVSEVTF